MDDLEAAKQRCVDDVSLYLDREQWFSKLQDSGTEASDAQKSAIDVHSEKKFTRKIRVGYMLHSTIYDLASDIHQLMLPKKAEYFGKMANTKTVPIHMIGEWIVTNRRLVSRGDFHTGADQEFLDLTTRPEYLERQEFYFLSQKDVMRHFCSRWGESLKDALTPTIDDKLRIGLLLFHEDVREYVPDLLGKTLAAPNGQSNNNNRSNMDANTGRKNSARTILHNMFTDKEIVLEFPSQWLDPTTHEKIDEIKGAGTFESFANFDPNNESRIKLPWSFKDTMTVLTKFLTEYRTFMMKWTKDTGGGSGSDATYTCWQERDVCSTVSYQHQMAHLYITPVYMRDKEYSFLLVEKKDNLPKDCQFEDDFAGSTTKSSTKGKEEDKAITLLNSTLKEISASRSLQTEKFIQLLEGQNDPEPSDSALVVQQIKATTDLIATYKTECDDLNAQKDQILSSQGSSNDKRKRLAPVLTDLNLKRKVVKQLNCTLEKQTEELARINGVDKDDEETDIFDDVSIHST
eukprot:scaffold952_cov56-Cyclotella_meneghiniana.AAC.2